MATTVAFRFPWGRYHATPWGRHLNEAVVEWPPSCWRLLRGLYATWRSRAPEIPQEEVRELFDSLTEAPTYWLPEATDGHSRHYMPDSSHRLGFDGNTDKAFDPFKSFERDSEVFVEWNVDLDEDHRRALDHLVGLLPHLGRADSICVGRLLSRDEEPVGESVEPRGERGGTGLRLLVPTSPVDLDELAVDTLDLRSRRLPSPPGARWVDYTSPPDADTRRRPWRAGTQTRPTTVRWAIVSSARPSAYATIVMCDALRNACMSRFGKVHEGRGSPVLAGKDADGRPLTGHRHAHYLALDKDRDGLLDHLLLWAPDGLGPEELQAVASLTDLRGYGFIREFRPCRLGMEVCGSVEVAAPELLGRGPVWESATPFAPPRHRKKKETWEEFIDNEVRRELDHRGLPEPMAVRALRGRALAFRRHRIRERLEDARIATMIQFEFGEDVQGPITIGALSHFGLGTMVPSNRVP